MGNSEIWDIRTFHLLQTCPALDQCSLVFSDLGDIIYALKHDTSDSMMAEAPEGRGPFESSFRTFDASDYSSIGTLDVRKPILDLKPNHLNTYLALIEFNHQTTLDFNTTCRLVDMGTIKHPDDEHDDDEDQSISDIISDFLNNGDDNDNDDMGSNDGGNDDISNENSSTSDTDDAENAAADDDEEEDVDDEEDIDDDIPDIDDIDDVSLSGSDIDIADLDSDDLDL